MSNNFARSIFLERLVPQYIREEYPLFISFLKEYYNYLDRYAGQLVAVTMQSAGNNYSNNPTIAVEIIDTRTYSPTYGKFIKDWKGASFSPFVINGKLEKILVVSYGADYSIEDQLKFIITDTTGSGATASPVIIESAGNISQAVTNSQYNRDIDNEVSIFVNFLINEYIPKFPKSLYSDESHSVELNKFIKFIRQFYNSVGIEDSISFLYRILFNAPVNFYYPKTDMLRISDGRWYVDKVLNITSSLSNLESFISHRLLGDSGTTAIIDSVVQTDTYSFQLFLSSIVGNFSSNLPENIYDYPITGKGEKLGVSFADSNGNYYFTANGQYVGDNGQLSSSKVIQDSYYYQDFSYELQSEASIRQFKNILEDLVHPAGLIYFIRMNLESVAGFKESVSDELDILNFFDSIEIYLSHDSNHLGPIFKDIDKYKFNVPPIPFVDFTGTFSVIPSDSYSSFVVSTYSEFSNNSDEFTNYSVILTDALGVQFFRRVAAYTAATRTIELDSAFTPTATPVVFEIIQNYRGSNYDFDNHTFKLSDYDPCHAIPYSGEQVTTLESDIPDDSVTSINVNTSDEFNLAQGDIIQIDNEQMSLGGSVVGDSGFFTLFGVNRGVNSTSAVSHNTGAGVYNLTDHRFYGWNIFFFTGPGSPAYTKVMGYQPGGATGIIQFDYSTMGGSTSFSEDTTYWLAPDYCYGNNDYFSTGASGIDSIIMSKHGTGYPDDIDITIDPPWPGGSTATAHAIVGATGVITNIVEDNLGSNYFFSPILTVGNGATGMSPAFAYVNIINANSSMNSYGKYNQRGGVVLYIPDASSLFIQATATANLLNNLIFSCSINNHGKGYVVAPRVIIIGGGGLGADAYSEISNFEVSNIYMSNLGTDYVSIPRIYIDPPGIFSKERIYQPNTGARGIVNHWDSVKSLLYIQKDTTSPEFDTSSIVYNNINIPIESIKYCYSTLGKRINTLPESDISVYKQQQQITLPS